MTTPHIEALHRLFEFSGALSIAVGAMAWWRKGSAEDDEMVSEASDLVLDALSDADATRKTECLAGRNWREDVTVEEAEEMNKERELRRWGFGRN